MMARNRCVRRRSVCMWTFPWKAVRSAGEIIGGALFFTIMIFALNIIA